MTLEAAGTIQVPGLEEHATGPWLLLKHNKSLGNLSLGNLKDLRHRGVNNTGLRDKAVLLRVAIMGFGTNNRTKVPGRIVNGKIGVHILLLG